MPASWSARASHDLIGGVIESASGRGVTAGEAAACWGFAADALQTGMPGASEFSTSGAKDSSASILTMSARPSRDEWPALRIAPASSAW